jgi:hypothetical protein
MGALERLRQSEFRLETAQEELSAHRVRRADLAIKLKQREAMLDAAEQTLLWKVIKFLQRVGLGSPPAKAEAPLSDNVAFAIDHPTDWRITAECLRISGWCFAKTGNEIVGVRAKVDGRIYYARYGITRNDVAEGLDIELGSGAPRGFRIDVPLPDGRSIVRLDAIVHGQEWQPFFEHDVERLPA